MKAEYANFFTISINPDTNEVVIVFKQETNNPTFQNKVVVSDNPENVEVGKIIMNMGNAWELKNTLDNCFKKFENNQDKAASDEQ